MELLLQPSDLLQKGSCAVWLQFEGTKTVFSYLRYGLTTAQPTQISNAPPASNKQVDLYAGGPSPGQYIRSSWKRKQLPWFAELAELLIGVGSTEDRDTSPSTTEQSLQPVLRRLTEQKVLPNSQQWSMFYHTCSSRDHQRDCSQIFRYFRNVVLRRSFPRAFRRPDSWLDESAVGVAKYGKRPYFLADMQTFVQYGDDALSMASGHFSLSDGITRDPDSDFFSRQVIMFIDEGLRRIDSSENVEEQLFDLVKVLQELIERSGIPAAATLSLGFLARPLLWIASLGDSEVKMLRNGRVVHRTPLQRVGNVPGQLNAHKLAANKNIVITPVPVKRGDVVVAASDGMWDNLLEGEVARIVHRHQRQSAKKIAALLMANAGESRDAQHKRPDPHSSAEKPRMVGGRKDDISIIVLKV